MSLISSGILAFSMSADAFAVSVGKGAVHKPLWREALRTGAIFGIVEGITPVLGWLMGLAASRYIQEIDHWVAFFILGAVGCKLIYESFGCDEETEEKPRQPKFGLVVVTAIGTSIDALAVGVTLALIDTNIWAMAAAIGTAPS
jgi:putative Mn2+ efflux pump MntP